MLSQSSVVLGIILVPRQGIPEGSIASSDKDKKRPHGHPEQGDKAQEGKNAGIEALSLGGITLAKTGGAREGWGRQRPRGRGQDTRGH